MKICTHCKLKKKLTEFSWKIKRKNLKAKECKSCHRVMRMTYYRSHKKEEYARVKEHKQRIAVYVSSKKKKCCHCGENHPATLHFHHLDPSKKDIDIARVANNGWSRQRINKELSKCIVLCANCHAKEHYKIKHSKTVGG